ncbi:PD-(D/E)XK nuclease superfamily protein [Enterobacter cloacae complex sp. ESBL7]|uniref:PD-(D/E)XK nuclease superfamily protein n=1 Tax=Enterobacter cloacae complex TaxID=354276 RepID=UPI0035632FB1
MSRAELLRDIEAIVSGAGFELNNSETPMTFKKNVSYSGLIAGKNEIAHFLLFTNRGTIQITAKWQEVNGTAIEKLGHTALDAQNTQHQHYFVVCGGGKLVTRAIDYLNDRQSLAPRLRAMQVRELESALEAII